MPLAIVRILLHWRPAFSGKSAAGLAGYGRPDDVSEWRQAGYRLRWRVEVEVEASGRSPSPGENPA
jgi:hypothetical protein